MVEIKEIVKDVEEVLEPEDSEEVEGGIFDEDFEDVDEEEASSGVFDEDFEPSDEEEPISDFDIGSTMLTAAAPVESWAGQNLEETLSRERVEKDWGDEEDAFSGDFYKSSDDRGDVYGAKDDVYSSGGGRGDGVYSESGGAYDAKAGTYDVKGGDTRALKSHEQVQNERRGGRGLLESSFSDRHKRENRAFNRDAVAYEAGKAA